MSNRVGSSTTYTSILPSGNNLRSVSLSREAKHRLRVIEYYLGCRSVALTCRHFGICRSYFYKWYSRFNPRNLQSLESLSRRPHRLRPATYDYELVKLVRKLRQAYPRYSSKKLGVILSRDYDIAYSAATIGRIIHRFKLYFSKVIRIRNNRKGGVKSWVTRKPYDLKASGPRQVIEFDMKHIYLSGIRRYAFVAADAYTKEAVIHVGSQPSSAQARLALEQAVARFGKQIAIVNDNGSENFARALEYLKEQNITQYFARPHTPKDKPHVENLIGKLQQECLDEDRSVKTVPELQNQVNRWLNVPLPLQ
ncbi:MAG TPA: DDE-type integrase/transposase/recombinase [Candidatus Saccharimonadales bacterium]|nr:DDE-type integrase/transposase/recombinase [Candidatus Saccharimonadales bacterium]